MLLVEDDPNSVFFFEHVAKKLGIANSIQVAKDGQEALDYLDGRGSFADGLKHPRPALVILDLKLPFASGFDVLQHIRAQPALRKIVVVMLTASASEKDITQAYQLGANAYLVKPLQLEDLEMLVKAIRDFWLTHNRFAPKEWRPGV